MKALLLIGGFGTRLRPFTITTPKALLPVVNIPFIKYQFELFKKYNIDEIVLAVGYKGEEFKKIYGIAKDIGLKVYLSFENEPLGTGGGIRNAYEFLKGKEPFFVFNGDILSDFNLDKILDFHREKNAYVTIGLVKVDNPSEFGLVITDENNRIKQFIEKPKLEEIVSDKINAGVYIFQPEVLEEIPPKKSVSIEKETFPQILQKGKEMFGYIHYGYWLDVGTIDKFKKGNFDVLEGKITLCYNPGEKNIEIDSYSFVSDNISVEEKLVAGKNTLLKENIKIKGKCIVGDGCFIVGNCTIENSIIFRGVYIEENCRIENCIIGNNVIIKSNSYLRDMAIADKGLIYDWTRRIE